MTPDELPAYLEALAARVAAAAAAAADAMADAEHRYLVTNVLARYTHPPHTKTTSPPGQPPALVTGTLRRSLRVVPAPPAPRTTASLAPHTVSARIQEAGGDIYPVRAGVLRWAEDGVTHFSKHVRLPARPYMRPGRDDLVADGTFRREASAAFERVMGLG
jgi:hypothetical protein